MSAPVLRLGLASCPGARLRPWADGDAAAALLLDRDPLVRHYSGSVLHDVTDARAWIARRRSLWDDGEGGAWALDDGREVVGRVTVHVLDADLGAGSVGYALAPAARGRGLATAAVGAAVARVFADLGWHRVELYHAVENAASCAVARRAGFPYEGTMRQAMRYADGRRSDEHLHARLASDPPVSPRGPGRARP